MTEVTTFCQSRRRGAKNPASWLGMGHCMPCLNQACRFARLCLTCLEDIVATGRPSRALRIENNEVCRRSPWKASSLTKAARSPRRLGLWELDNAAGNTETRVRDEGIICGKEEERFLQRQPLSHCQFIQWLCTPKELDGPPVIRRPEKILPQPHLSPAGDNFVRPSGAAVEEPPHYFVGWLEPFSAVRVRRNVRLIRKTEDPVDVHTSGDRVSALSKWSQ